jgi:histidinol-phosphate aminotransferase
MAVRLRSDLANLPAYRAGRRPQAGPDGRLVKLSSNENPFPPLPGVVAAIAAAAAEVRQYPDPAATRLIDAIAEFMDVAPERVAVGTGAVSLVTYLALAAAGPGDEIVYAWRSFEAYPIVAALAGATAVPIPLGQEGRHDLAAMAAAINERTRLVFLCSPNNPTGPTLSREEVRGFLEAVPDDLLVVLDEAYAEYVRDPFAVSGIRDFLDRPNVVVLRSFSKAYGLAGLRVGYAVGPVEVISMLRSVALPFGVTDISAAAVIASLASVEELTDRVDAVVAERERVVDALVGLGFEVPATEANFYWLPLGGDTTAFTAECEALGITVRPFADEGVRVTIGLPEDNDLVLEVARRFAH